MTYSPTADALSIRLAEDRRIVGTKEITTDVFADFDDDGNVIALEFLNASRRYDKAKLEGLAIPVEYLTLAEAAKEGRLAVTTLRNQITARRLAGVKRGRDWLVTRHDLWNYLESRGPQGRPGKSRRVRLRRKKRPEAVA
jgi:uncharacterized protein YuzE